ncbi:MAG: desulfoferrodoxin [Schwartzia sp.]|nr:desulfoferrodoxin [Schwartzia sp. (in: firmicutes)]
MKFEPKFLRCRTCGRLVMALPGGKDSADCCGEGTAELLTANTTDASQEKHVPVIEAKGSQITVKIGSAPHPMVDAHYIQWIYLQTKKGGQFHFFTSGDDPEATFALTEGDAPVAAYEYCNLHGLWKVEV